MAKSKPSKRPSKSLPDPGDLVLVWWVDIASSSHGDAADATVPVCINPGFWYGRRVRAGERVVILEKHVHSDGGDWSKGYDIYPASVVRKVEVVRKKGDIPS